MKVIADTLQVQSKCENHTIDVTDDVQDIIQRSSISNGLVTVFVAGSTGAVTTIEYEPGPAQGLPGHARARSAQGCRV